MDDNERIAAPERAEAQVTRPLAQAVVIGIGGTGAQVVGRLNGAIRGGRVDQHAVDSVEMLLFDAAADPVQQMELPPGSMLRPGVGVHTFDAFIPAGIVRQRLGADSHLTSWWDERHKLAMDPMEDGLRRDRMLGRLWFYHHSEQIRAAIAGAVTRATRIDPALAAEVDPRSRAVLPVYIVCSTAGGTGSSGFLEVVAAVHAATPNGWYPRIRAFLLMPGAFEVEASRAVGGDVLLARHKANAYGFFKELDHFLVEPQDLSATMGMPTLHFEQGDSPVHQVNLIDSRLGTMGSIGLRDAYEIVAESMYQFMFTEMGRNLIESDGVNYEAELSKTDARGKPTRYCSIGVSRVVFPGDTYRNHLSQWWRHWMLTQGFLRRPSVEEVEAISVDKDLRIIVDGVNRLLMEVTEAAFGAEVEVFRREGRNMGERLAQTPDPQSAQEAWGAMSATSASVVITVRQVLNPRRVELLQRLNDDVRTSVFKNGASVPLAKAILQKVQAQTKGRIDETTEFLNGQLQAKNNAAQVVVDRIRALQNAEAENLLESLWGRVAGRSKEDRARAVGEAIKDWSEATVEAELADARAKFAQASNEAVRAMIEQLELAETELVRLAGLAEKGWRDDTLFGKDAGSHYSTFLVPKDMRPHDGRPAEIEDSELATESHRAILEEHGARVEGPALAEFIASWCKDSSTLGFFDVGAAGGSEAQRRAVDALLNRFDDEAERFALTTRDAEGNVVPRLPRSVVAAAEKFGESPELAGSLRGLVAASRHVAWQFDEARVAVADVPEGVRVPRGATGVSSAVTYHPSNAAIVESALEDSGGVSFKMVPTFPDPERVVALSVQWAVALHTLPVVSDWKREYDALMALTEQRSIHNQPIPEPPHIDKRYVAYPDPLPRTLDPSEAIDVVFKALVLDRLFQDPAHRGVILPRFQSDHTRPAAQPLRFSPPDSQFMGREIELAKDGKLQASENEIPLGGSLLEAVDAVCKSEVLPESVDLLWRTAIQEFAAIDSMQAVLDAIGGLGDGFSKKASDRSATDSEQRLARMMLNSHDAVRRTLTGF